MPIENSKVISQSNPTLEDLLIPFIENEKSNSIQNPSILFKELENVLMKMDIPTGILDFMEKINAELKSNNLFEVKENKISKIERTDSRKNSESYQKN